MGATSSIEWTDATWNPIRARSKGVAGNGADKTYGRIGWHCEHVSEGCRNCYAETMNRRLGTGLDFKPGNRSDIEIFLNEKMLLAPLHWKKPRHIFVNSMSDTFADFVKDEWLDRMFAVMALCPQHTFQCLTKRPDRMLTYLCGPWAGDGVAARIADATRFFAPERKQFPLPPVICDVPVGPRAKNGEPEFGYRRMFHPKHWPLPNVWLGISAEDQAAADERIPLLLETPAAVRFVSLEPLLGPIDLGIIRKGLMHPRLRWVIVGGESGPHARPMHPDWARSLRDQCAAAEVPFFFKQWGSAPPRYGHMMKRLGKKAAGRLLDGIEHNGMPSQ